jgi:hypothetical protein
MLQEVPEPVFPLCGFCSWPSLSAFAHCYGWLSRLPGIFCAMITHMAPLAGNRIALPARQNHIGLVPKGEIEHGRNQLQARQPRLLVRAVTPRCLEYRAGGGIGNRPGRDLRPHRRAAGLHTRSCDDADLRCVVAGVTVWPRTRIRLPGALPDGRRRRPAGVQPAWSWWSSSDATCSLIPLRPLWRVCFIGADDAPSWLRSRLQDSQASSFLPPAPAGSRCSPTRNFLLSSLSRSHRFSPAMRSKSSQQRPV